MNTRFTPISLLRIHVITVLFVALSLFTEPAISQNCNLVINGNFEELNTSFDPADIDSYLIGWSDITGSCDIFERDYAPYNIPNSTINYDDECDTWDNDNGLNGNDHFMGIGVFSANGDHRELLQGSLSNTLNSGWYNFKAKVKVIDGSTNAASDQQFQLQLWGHDGLYPNGNDIDFYILPSSDPDFVPLIGSGVAVSDNNSCNWSTINVDFYVDGSVDINHIVIGSQNEAPANSFQYLVIDNVEITTTAPDFVINPLSVCEGETASLSGVVTPTGGTYTGNYVTGNSFDASIADPGTYPITYIYVDEYGCEYQQALNVQVLQSPTVNVISNLNINNTYCTGTEFLLTATGAIDYTWQPETGLNVSSGSSVEAAPDLTTTYIVTGSNAAGCQDQANITVQIFPMIELNALVDGPSCDGISLGCIDLQLSGGLGDLDILWSGVPPGNANLEDQCGLDLGSYFVTISDDNCSISESITVGYGYSSQGAEMNSNPESNALSDQVLSFSGNLVFNQNCNDVVISNTVFYFGPNAGIEVQEGAKVVFNDCDFLPCANNWLGINARSNSDNTITPADISLHGGSIVGAWDGIRTKDERPGTQQFNVAWRGAKIHVSNVSFINNWNAIDIRRAIDMSGGAFNYSFFQCHIETNDDFFSHFNSFPHSQVYYVKMSGYSFRACSFVNSMNLSSIDRWSRRGNGIYGSRARFSVRETPTTTSYIPSTFQGFNRGIYAYNVGTKNQGVEVKYSEFQQNDVAILTSGVQFSEISKNTITVGELTGNIALDNQSGNWNTLNDNIYEGIAIRRGDFMEIAENEISGTQIIHAVEVGICIRDTQTEDDELYHNWLSNLDRGIQSDGDNAGSNNLSGLRFICNQNTDNYYDFIVSDFVGSNQPAVAPNQEVPGYGEVFAKPSRNSFTGNEEILANGDGHFRNDWELPINYLFKFSVNAEEPTVYEQFSFFPTSTTESFECEEIYDDTYPGPDDYESMPVISEWEAIADAIRVEYISNKLLYYSLLDEGDTEELRYDVIETWGEDVWEMRERLLSGSPYLSKVVLYEVADRTTTYPHPIALEVFLANPDILRDRSFMAHLETKADPMPEYMIDLLLATSNQTTQRTIIEQNLGASRSTYMYFDQLAMRSRLNRPDFNEQLLLDRLNEWECLSCEYSLIENDIDNGNIATALDRYANLPNKIKLGHSELRDYNKFDEWMNLRIALYNNGGNWDALTSTEFIELENLVDYFYTYAGVHAMEVLNASLDEVYYIPPSTEQGWSPRTARIEYGLVHELIQIFPNPADYLVNISVTCPFSMNSQNGTFTIFDVTGRTVHHVSVSQSIELFTIDTREWASGFYLYKLSLPTIESKTGRFEIQH